MVYARKMGTRRRRYGYKKRGYTTYGATKFLAKKAYNMALKVAGIVNAEKKTYDNDLSFSPSTTGTISLITAIGQGDGDNTRDGNSIALKSSLHNWLVSWNTAGSTSSMIRLIIFRNIDDDTGQFPAVSDLLVTANTRSPLNIQHASRFRILMDQKFSRDTNINTINGSFFHKYFTKKDYQGNKTVQEHCKWYDSTGTHTTTGHLYALCLSSETANLPTVNLYNRVRFFDN